VCSITVPPQSTSASSVVATFTAGPKYDLSKCAGYYGFLLNSQTVDTCMASTDKLTMSLTCPKPPVVSVGINVTLLWNGKSFVRSDVAPGPSHQNFTFNDWVQIDTRATLNANYNQSGNLPVTYTLNITSQPPALWYLGASSSGRY
jgi:hypothetical protein